MNYLSTLVPLILLLLTVSLYAPTLSPVQVDKSETPIWSCESPLRQRRRSRTNATRGTPQRALEPAIGSDSTPLHQRSAGLAQRATARRPERPSQTRSREMRHEFRYASLSSCVGLEPRLESRAKHEALFLNLLFWNSQT